MLPANTHLNVLIGLDVHIVMVPTPAGPVPTPLPHPFVGYVFDIGDLIPKFGATVFVNYKFRGCSFTNGMLGMMKHLPTPPGASFSPKPIGHDAYNFFGSLKVKAEGNLMAVSPFSVMSCNCIGIPLTLSVKPGNSYKPVATTYAPTSASIPIPTGPPVLVGGPYVPDLMGMLMSLVMSYGFSAILKLFGRALNALLKKLDLNCTKGLSEKLCHMFGEPVDLATGRVVYSITDFEIPGPLPIKWKRSWYSDSGYNGMLGHGTHLCYDLSLFTNHKEGVIGVILPDGRATAFALLLNNEENFYNRPEKLTLIKKEEGFDLIDHAEQLTWHFSRVEKNKYKPSSLRNLSGFTIKFKYDRTGKLIKITDAVGRQIDVLYDEQGRAISVNVFHKGAQKKLVDYDYNEAGDLNSITDPMGQTTRIKYTNHLMLEKTDRNGETFYWDYDGPFTGAKCIHTRGDNGLLEGWITYTKKYTTVTNSLQETTTYFYNDARLCTKIVDPLGGAVEFEYTDDMELYRSIDQEGNITGYVYDNRGNIISKHYADNAAEMFLYNEDDQVKLKSFPEGQTTVYTYNENKLLRSISATGTGVTVFEYNSDRQLVAIKNEHQQTVKLYYDEDHNLSSLQLADGRTAQWLYDAWGRCIQTTNPEGAGSLYHYDDLNRIIQIKESDGNNIRLQYDAYGEVLLAKDNKREVEFSYNALGSMLTRREAGVSIKFHYDSQNRLTSLSNELNEIYRFGLDENGRVIKETGFDGLTRLYERDRAGKVMRTQRPGGRWSEYEYDLRGRVTRAEHSDGSWETFSYNKNGQLSEAVNEVATVKFVRDKAGRLVKEQCGNYRVETVYDESGNRSRISSSLGASIDQQFSESGMLNIVKAQSGESEAWEASFRYNKLGQETERYLTGGIKSSFEYDQAGRPVKHRVSSGSRETLQRAYTWSVNNRLTRMVNELSGGAVSYGHDDFSNLAWARYETGVFDYRVPDEAGNLYKTEDRSDCKYGRGGRLLSSASAGYTYDEEGNLIAKDERNGNKWSYEWQGNGMLKKVIRPDGKEVCFEYDALGRRISKTFDKKKTRWLWNGNVPLHEWHYAEADNPRSVINESGDIVDDKPEPVTGLTSWIFDNGSFRPAAKITDEGVQSIITDYLGTPMEMYNAKGEKTWEAIYDIRGKIRKLEKGSLNDCPFRYQGQYEDVETGLYYNRFRYYDPKCGSYVQKDVIGLSGGKALYSYTRNPNALIDPFGLSSFDPFEFGEITPFPDDLHFGQDRIAPNFSTIGSQADPAIVGRSISDVASDIASGELDPSKMVIAYTIDPDTGKAVTLNNRGLAALAEGGKMPEYAIKVPYEKAPPHLVADFKGKGPSKSINITENKDGSGFIRKITNCK